MRGDNIESRVGDGVDVGDDDDGVVDVLEMVSPTPSSWIQVSFTDIGAS
jgi:hypothetical protein